jgi:predicted nucleic acid-binding protein
MRTAIDTNVISSLWSQEPAASRMAQLLQVAYQAGSLVICGAVYAELHAYPNITPVFIRQFLSDTHIQVDYTLSSEVWDTVAVAYAGYADRRRKHGGESKRLLVDFIVGAHALHTADQLLTLDQSRYQTAYPTLTITL